MFYGKYPVRKYHNSKPKFDGLTWDSQKELNYYLLLKDKKRLGEIKDYQIKPAIELQPKFRYQGQTVRAVKIIPDFLVLHLNGKREYVDTKGYPTKDWLMKWKLLQYQFRDDPDVLLTIKK